MPTQGKNGAPKQGKKAKTTKSGFETPEAGGAVLQAEAKASKKTGKKKKGK